MFWYRTGTISCNNGSDLVTGIGTDFINGTAPGEAVQMPDGKPYEILQINSASGAGAIQLASPYLGSNFTSQAYAIVPTQSYIRDLAGQAAALVNGFATTRDNAFLLTVADKTTPVDTDRLAAKDVTDGTGKWFTWANIKATLKTYLDTLYSVKAGSSSLTTVGALNSGSITSGFGSIDVGTESISGGAGHFVGATTINASTAGATPALNVKGTTYSLIGMQKGADAQGVGINLYNAANTQKWFVGMPESSDNFSFYSTVAPGMVATFTPTGLNATVIGATTPAAGSFTTLSATGSVGAISTDSSGARLTFSRNSVNYITATGAASALYIGAGGVDGQLVLDTSGNLGLGVTPSGNTKLQVKGKIAAQNGGIDGTFGDQMYFMASAYPDTQQHRIRGSTSGIAANNLFAFESSTSTTGVYNTNQLLLRGDGAVSLQNGAMTLDASGNLLVGVTTATWAHEIKKSVAEGAPILTISGGAAPSVFFLAVDASGYSAANSAMLVNKDAATARSINCAGTVNASGADYAEYERNNGLTITKGSIVGFKADGTLTATFSEAVRFGIKSTNPSYVGGDTWGSEEIVGKRPDEPQRVADKTEQRLIGAAVPATETEPALEAIYGTAVIEAGDTDAEWQAKQDAYAAAKAAFEAALETARQQVDRIAYSGKVPCNVTGAIPGGYIIAVESAGAIAGEFVADPDFAQYKKAVGRVNRILPDGRCEVAVIVH